MKVILLDYGNYPFLRSAALTLRSLGYSVQFIYNVAYPSPNGGEARVADPLFIPIGLESEIVREKLWPRFRDEWLWAKRACAVFESFAPDVIISANAPLAVQQTVAAYCVKNQCRFIYWLQDFHGQAISAYFGRRSRLLGRSAGFVYTAWEKRLLSAADQILAISPGHVQQLLRMQVPEDRITLMPNWAPIEEYPVRPKDNDWSRQHGLSETFNFLYTGTLATKHDPDLFIALSASLVDQPSARVVVISQGTPAETLRMRAKQMHLRNLIVMDFQPHNKMPELLASGDVLMTVLRSEAGEFSVPSKTTTYLCAGRAQLLSVPPQNAAAVLVKQIGAGLVARPGNTQAFLDAAKQLLLHHSELQSFGDRARRYAEEAYQPTTAIKPLLTLLDRAAGQTPQPFLSGKASPAAVNNLPVL